MTVAAPPAPAELEIGAPRRASAVVLAVVALGVSVVLSLMVGAEALSPMTVIRELVSPGDTEARDIIRGLRMDRTVVALVVGLALGGAGALMQALTRNPLADPGLLGVNAGAAAAIVTGIAFFQIEDPLTRHHGGAGLGLFVAQGIITAHGSRIEVVSELGKGATFTFRLRIRPSNGR